MSTPIDYKTWKEAVSKAYIKTKTQLMLGHLIRDKTPVKLILEFNAIETDMVDARYVFVPILYFKKRTKVRMHRYILQMICENIEKLIPNLIMRFEMDEGKVLIYNGKDEVINQ